VQSCPSCYQDIPDDAPTCPGCAAALDVLSARDYTERLIAALEHPLADVRMRAILVLGMRREDRAVLPFEDLVFRHPAELAEGLAVVESLSRIGTRPSRRVLAKVAVRHPARAVRDAARTSLMRT
jgi:hypothetical protein